MTEAPKPAGGTKAGSKQAPAAGAKNTAAPANKMVNPGSAGGYKTK